MAERFSATVEKIGANPAVTVPAGVSASLGSGYVPVRGTLSGAAFRTGLVSLGMGRHRLFLNQEMRESADVHVGDVVEIELERDPEPRKVTVPRQLSAALRSDKALHAAWRGLTPSHRNEILAYLNSLKSDETVARNVEKLRRKLTSG